jgi:tetratricopeptide (TPR) repeat protein
MIDPKTDVAALVREVSACAPNVREERLRAIATSRESIDRLCDELDHFAMADLNAAMGLGELLVNCAEATGNPHAIGRARRTWAQMLAYANRFEQSLEQVHRAVEAARKANEPAEEARAMLTSLHALARLGRFDEAIAHGEAAREVFSRLNETRLKARASANLGVTHRMRDDPARALSYFAEAIELLADDPMATAQLQSNRAEALLDTHQFDEAEHAFINARQQFEQIGARRAAAIVEGNLADLLSRQGRLDEALRHFDQAINALHGPELAAPGDVARLRAEAAEAYAAAGAWEEALQMYELALGPLAEHGMAWETARALAGLGVVLARTGQHEAAERRLREAAKRFDELGHQTAAARAEIALGDLAMRSGRANHAKELFVASLEKLTERPIDACQARHRLAQLALWSENLPAAETLLKEAIRTLDGRHHAPILAELWRTRAHLRREQGRQKEAIDDLRRAVEYVERIRGVLPPGRLRTSFLGTRADVYGELLLMLLDAKDVDSGLRPDELCTARRAVPQLDREAFRVAEQARCRTLLDLMSGAMAAPLRSLSSEIDSDSDFRSEQADGLHEVIQLRRILNALYSKADLLSWHKRESSVGTSDESENRQTFERLERLERELALAESRLAIRGNAGGIFAEPNTVEQIIAAMPDGAALVEYFSASGGIGAFVIHNGELSVHRHMADQSTFDEHRKRFEFQLSRSLARFASRSGHDPSKGCRSDELPISGRIASQISARDINDELATLYELLMQPLASMTEGAKRLLIVPVGSLHGIPFPALFNRRSGRYLIEDYEVGILPSASLLDQLIPVTPASPREGRTEAIGETQPDDGMPPLIVGVADEHAPSIDEEVRAVQRILRNADVLIGAEATADRVLASMRGRSLVHLACHGRFVPWKPMGSGLRLADRWLTIRELFESELRGATVMLSACETGRGRIESGEESIGLIQGFFAAGARRILTSIWPLNDEYAQKMVAAAYDLWQNRDGPFASVLATVQRRMIEENVHPALWAPIMLIGKE